MPDAIVGPEPYPGYDAEVALRFALSCLQCPDPAPCISNCRQNADIRGVMRWVGQNGCAGFSLTRWAALLDETAERQAATALTETYNH
jgi:hypothetical protein